MPDITQDERILELNQEFAKEIGEWEKIGVEPNNVMVFNPFKVDSWIQILTQFLSEKGIIDQKEFVIFMKEQQIKTLREVRIEVEGQIRNEKLKGMGVQLPNMEVPKGKIRKIH